MESQKFSGHQYIGRIARSSFLQCILAAMYYSLFMPTSDVSRGVIFLQYVTVRIVHCKRVVISRVAGMKRLRSARHTFVWHRNIIRTKIPKAGSVCSLFLHSQVMSWIKLEEVQKNGTLAVQLMDKTCSDTFFMILEVCKYFSSEYIIEV